MSQVGNMLRRTAENSGVHGGRISGWLGGTMPYGLIIKSGKVIEPNFPDWFMSNKKF